MTGYLSKSEMLRSAIRLAKQKQAMSDKSLRKFDYMKNVVDTENANNSNLKSSETQSDPFKFREDPVYLPLQPDNHIGTETSDSFDFESNLESLALFISQETLSRAIVEVTEETEEQALTLLHHQLLANKARHEQELEDLRIVQESKHAALQKDFKLARLQKSIEDGYFAKIEAKAVATELMSFIFTDSINQMKQNFGIFNEAYEIEVVEMPKILKKAENIYSAKLEISKIVNDIWTN
jgi:Radial spoke protein 3